MAWLLSLLARSPNSEGLKVQRFGRRRPSRLGSRGRNAAHIWGTQKIGSDTCRRMMYSLHAGCHLGARSFSAFARFRTRTRPVRARGLECDGRHAICFSGAKRGPVADKEKPGNRGNSSKRDVCCRMGGPGSVGGSGPVLIGRLTWEG